MQETTFDLKEWKKAKLDAIRNHHADLIKDLEISPLDFNMKKSFYNKNGVEVVGIFGSEFRKEKGFFFELISSDLDPIDPERKVYRVPPCINYDEEYELNPKNSYNVPLEELRVVNPAAVAIGKSAVVMSSDSYDFRKEKAELNLSKLDAPYSEMTIRDYVAIHTGRPVSNKEWLNDLVKSIK